MGRRRCCCFNDCGVFADDFDRPDGGPGGNWWIRSGNWTISGLELREGGNADALIVASTRTRNEEQHVTVKLTNMTPDKVGQIVFNYVDDDNYMYVEIARERITLYRRILGVVSQLREKITPQITAHGLTIPVNICASKILIAIQTEDAIGSINWMHVCKKPLFAGGFRAGLGNGADVSVTFDDFYLSDYYGILLIDGITEGECCFHPCKCREGGIDYCIPEILTVTISAGGGCAPIDGYSFPIIYRPDQDFWENASFVPACMAVLPGIWRMYCNKSPSCWSILPAPAFAMVNDETLGGGCTTTDECMLYHVAVESHTCDPLVITFPRVDKIAHGPGMPHLCGCCDPYVDSWIQLTATG